MAITSTGGGNPIIRIESTAKNGTLGAQGSINANQIVLPSSLNAANNGNVTAPLVGRLIILRRGSATEETKKITVGANTDTTITVHEDWTVPPTSGDTFDISYVFGDLTAFTGMTLSAKTGIYEASRAIHVGLTSGATFAYLALKDSEAFEIRDSATDPGLVIEPHGRFDVGYTQSGEPVGGGIMHTLNDGASEASIRFNSGSIAKWYDTVSISFRAPAGFSADSGITTRTTNTTINGWKVVNLNGGMSLTGTGSYKNINISGQRGLGTQFNIAVGRLTGIDGWTVAGPSFTSVAGYNPETIKLKNVTWNSTFSSSINVISGTVWNVVNPTWTVLTNSHRTIAWSGAGAGTGQVFEKFTLDLTTVSASGEPISGSTVYIYEGLLNQNLPNSGTTDLTGSFLTEVQTRRFTSGSTTLIVTQSGDFALKTYRYGFEPFVAAVSFDEAVTQQVALIVDTNLSAANSTDAIANGSTSIQPIKHGPGETDPLPLKVIHYDNGTGTVPSTGQIVSGTTSNASGSVLEVRYGDATGAYLVLSGWNGIQFTNNETIGNGSGWSALADISGDAQSFDAEYTWEYDMAGFTHQVVYDYDRARTAQDPAIALTSYKNSIIWGGDEQTNMIYSDGTNYFTLRNISTQEGVWLADPFDPGLVGYMTSDSGSLFTPPQTYSFTLTGLQTDSEIRIYNSDTNAEIAGTESSGTTFSYSYVYAGSDTNIFVVIFNLLYKDIRLVGLTLSNANQSIPIQQQTDRVYSNP